MDVQHSSDATGVGAFVCAARWADAIGRPAAQSRLHTLVLRLRAVLTAAAFDPSAAAAVGAGLVQAQLTDPGVLAETAGVLDAHLGCLTGRDDAATRTRLVLTLGALSAGYAEALRERVHAEHRHALTRLRHLAHHDPLTGLPNRALLADRLSQVLRMPPASRIGLCFLDLDGFKQVNDSFGHQAGDRLLAAVAERMSGCVAGHGQLLARTGGDEFVILVVHDRAGTAASVADRVVRALAAPFHVDGHELRVSASIGVVERQLDGTVPADLFEAADATMYRAKSAGKGRWAMGDGRPVLPVADPVPAGLVRDAAPVSR